MPVAKFCHEQDRVEASIFCQCVGDQLKSLAVSFADIAIVAIDCARVLLKLMRDFHFNTCTAIDERLLLHKSSDDTKSIMERAVSLVKNELVATSEEDRHGLALVGAASDFDNFAASASAALFNEASRAELISLKLINVGNRRSVDSLGDEINVIAIDVLDHHNLLLGEEMESKVVNGLSQHALLEKEYVGAGLDNFFDDSKDVLTLFLNDSIHSSIVTDNNV